MMVNENLVYSATFPKLALIICRGNSLSIALWYRVPNREYVMMLCSLLDARNICEASNSQLFYSI